MLVEYEIGAESFRVESANNVSRAVASLVFTRRCAYHVANTLLQTLILVGIGYLTLYFDVDNFTDRINVTITSLLVIATISSAIKEVRLILIAKAFLYLLPNY